MSTLEPAFVYACDPSGTVEVLSEHEYMTSTLVGAGFTHEQAGRINAGYDILTDDGHSHERAFDMLMTAERMAQDFPGFGFGAEGLARKMVHFRKALRHA